MQILVPEFKDDKDRLITIGMILTSAFLSFVPSLIVIFIPKEYISESTYQIAKAFFNFELTLFIISLFTIIPIIGWICGIFILPIVMIVNVIVILLCIINISKNNQFKVPEIFKFI